MEPLLETLRSSGLGSVLESCEPELQDLMRQIDIMMEGRQRGWEAQVGALQLRLHAGEQDLRSARRLAEQRDAEMGCLREQLEDAQTGRQNLATQYEEKLQKVHEELSRLKRSYQKLQRKHLKEASEGVKDREENHQRDKAELEERGEVERLQKEVSRLQEAVQTKDHEMRGQRSDLCKVEADLRQQLGRVAEERVVAVRDARKLGEELQRRRQSHAGEVEGVRREVARLAGEVHRRDLALGTLRGSASDADRHLSDATRRADRREAELTVLQLQLQSLKTENQHLSLLLGRLDSSQSPKRGGVASLDSLERENQLLRQEIAQMKSRLHASASERAPPPSTLATSGQSQSTCLVGSGGRAGREKEKEKEEEEEEEVQAMKAKLQENPTHYAEEAHRLLVDLSPASRQTHHTPAPPSSSATSSWPSPERRSMRKGQEEEEAGVAAGRRSSSSEEVLDPLEGRVEEPEPGDAEDVVSRFLEGEELRSAALLQRLDAHVRGMREDHARTARRYQPDPPP